MIRIILITYLYVKNNKITRPLLREERSGRVAVLIFLYRWELLEPVCVVILKPLRCAGS